MLYQFRCPEHGEIEVNQPMLSEHKAQCPICGIECQRIFSSLQVIWIGEIFRSDGSRRTQDDYAVLKG